MKSLLVGSHAIPMYQAFHVGAIWTLYIAKDELALFDMFYRSALNSGRQETWENYPIDIIFSSEIYHFMIGKKKLQLAL
ncbi:MAG: hypothetical protein A2W03_13105 [Candidatus Aminicenantes bacterium RBG_16_63_16]|nr:MAG: hypothetical protein A2W03_13105 [Candidatus Aminicenantes bacterium RBG_16_63_16]